VAAWTSNLSAAEATALAGVGLRPVGHVIGVSVFHVGWSGTSYCGGLERGVMRKEEWRGARAAGEWSGFGAVVAALRKVRRRALDQMRRNARDLGADGVVAVRLELGAYPGDRRGVAFTALGTAVRAESKTHVERPFLCALSALDVARLLPAGWVPVDIALGVAVEIEHHDADSRSVTGWRGVTASNAEVPAVTRLVNRTRAEARRTLEGELGRMHADGAVLSAMSLDVTDSECHVYEGYRDHVAESIAIATGIARVTATGSPRPLPLVVVPMREQTRPPAPAEQITAPLRESWLE
jgi:hypothetical protein